MTVTWTHKRLAEVCTLQRGFDLPTKDRKPGDNPLVSSSGIADFIDQSKVRGPGVVTGRSGSIGNVFFVEGDFWPLNTALYVKDFFGNDERFVCLLLQSLDLARFASGTGVPTLNRNHVSDEIVYVPESIDEQRRIVAVLDEAFAAIATATANAEKNLANAQDLLDCWLRGATEPSEEKAWPLYQLGSLTTKIGSGATPRGGKDSYLSEGTPLIRSLNVHDRRFKPEQLAFLDAVQSKLLANVTLQAQDVLLNITGASVARCCLLPDHLAGGRVNQHVSIIRTKRDALIPKFLELLLTSPYYKDRLLGVGNQGGSTRQAITKAEVQDFEIAVPTIEAQLAIIEKFQAVESGVLAAKNILSRKVALFATLKQSLLHRAFTGELTATTLETIAA